MTSLVCLLLLVLSLPPEDARHERSQGAQTVPSVRMADGKTWTARNLDIALEPSYCYDGIDEPGIPRRSTVRIWSKP